MTKQPSKRRPGPGRRPQGPIRKNAGWLQARITEELEGKLRRAAEQHGYSLSQEAQLRLKRSFELSSVQIWGPPEAKALAYLISRLARAVHIAVATDPTDDAGDLGWSRNPFTHAALTAAIAVLLEHYRPEGPVRPPPRVQESAERLERVGVGPEHFTPSGVGRSCALGLLEQLAIHRRAPATAASPRGEGHHALPDINDILGQVEELNE